MNEKTIYTTDSDQDGLTDAEELELVTNPFNSDTDGDGLSDLEEFRRGVSPTFKQTKETSYGLDL